MVSPIACDLTAMTPEQRERHGNVSEQLFAAAQERQELPDGFAWRYSPDPSTLMLVAEFISLECLCCPFFNFTLELEPERGPIWLRLTGREGVKDFLRAEIGGE